MTFKFDYFETDGQVHTMGGPEDDSNLSGYLYRVIDLEEADKETIHLLIFLLMQFMSRADLVSMSEQLKNTHSIIIFF